MAVDYESDRQIQEIQDEMYRRESERPKGGLSTLDKNSKFWLSAFVGGIFFLMWTGRMQTKTGLVILAITAFIIYMMTSNDPRREELTNIECMIRINDQLGFLQKNPIGDKAQIPKGKVHIMPVGRKQWYEGRPFKRSYAISIYDKKKGIKDFYNLEVDVFTGDIISFRCSPEGVIGDETKDIKLIPGYDMLLQKKRDQYLSKSYKV